MKNEFPKKEVNRRKRAGEDLTPSHPKEAWPICHTKTLPKENTIDE
jgi:hypothetical protein